MNSEERREAALAKADDVAWKLKNLCQVDIDDEILNMLSQQIAIAALEAAGLNELVEALEKIRRGPAKPAPDPIAHSWEAFARHMNGFAVDARMCAYAALTGDKSNG